MLVERSKLKPHGCEGDHIGPKCKSLFGRHRLMLSTLIDVQRMYGGLDSVLDSVVCRLLVKLLQILKVIFFRLLCLSLHCLAFNLHDLILVRFQFAGQACFLW